MYWDNYQIYASGSFDNIPFGDNNSQTFYLDIFQKNGTNARPLSITFGKDPVIHTWLDDEQNVPIKGSELRVNILNINNALPISNFVSLEDDTYKAEFYTYIDIGGNPTKQILFIGYLVLDECSEIKTDITHEIQLSFTDNLGVLKDVPFDFGNRMASKEDSDIRYANAYIYSYIDTTGKYLVLETLSLTPTVNDSIVIRGTPASDGTFKVLSVSPFNQVGWKLQLSETSEFNINATFADIWLIKNIEITNYIKLSGFLRICLQSTGLACDTIYGGKIEAVGSSTTYDDIFNNVLLHPDTFIKGSANEYESCYTVLESILLRFKMTLFQCYGNWYILRYNELRNYNNALKGIQYDKYFNNTAVLNSGITYPVNAGDGTDFEFGLLDTIYRPYRFYTEKFDYTYSDNLIRNGNVSQLGTLFIEYNSGNKKIKLYYWDFWKSLPNNGNNPNYYNRWFYNSLPAVVNRNAYIAIAYDANGIELERYGAIPSWQNDNILQGAFNPYTNLPMAPPIAVRKGDRIKISFSFKQEANIGGRAPIPIFVWTNMCQVTNLPGGQTPNGVYLNQDGKWGNLWETDVNEPWEWYDVDIESDVIPIDGLFSFCVPAISDRRGLPVTQQTFLGGPPYKYMTLIKDIRIEYISNIIGQNNIKGQKHKTIYGINSKNISEIDIKVDSADKPTINGNLCFDTKTNCVNDSVMYWRDGIIPNNFKLGEIVGKQEMLLKNKPRHKIEGRIMDIIRSQHILSPSKVLELGIFPDTYFTFGKMEINYKEDSANCTLYENWTLLEYAYDQEGVFPNINLIPKGILKDNNIIYNINYY